MEIKITELTARPRTLQRTGGGSNVIEQGRYATNADYREFQQLSRAYVWEDGQTVLEQFAYGRFSNPYKAIKPRLNELLEAVLSHAISARWSQKAGCTMCPCSPGFILNETFYNYLNQPVDFYAKYEIVLSENELFAAQEAAEDPELLEQIENRLAGLNLDRIPETV